MSLPTVAEMEAQFGEHVRRARLLKNLSQADLARHCGVSVSSVKALEGGHGARLATVLAVLRSLDKSTWLGMLEPRVGVQPMDLLLLGRERQRASKARPPDQQ